MYRIESALSLYPQVRETQRLTIFLLYIQLKTPLFVLTLRSACFCLSLEAHGLAWLFLHY